MRCVLHAVCCVQVLSPVHWSSYILLYRAEEQHMLHLIQPLWEQCCTQLWDSCCSSSSSSNAPQPPHPTATTTSTCQVVTTTGGSSSSSSSSARGAELVRWCSVLVLRAAFHPNVGVKRLGLSGLLNLSTPTLTRLVAEGGWGPLQELMLLLLPAFADRKLVGASSSSSRQAEAVAALQSQVGSFVGRCMLLLQQQQQQRDDAVLEGSQQQQQQQQQHLHPAVLQLTVRYLEAAPAAAGDKAPTLLFLLTALAQALKTAAADTASTISSSSSGGGSVSTEGLLAALLRVLAHVEFAQPSQMRPQLCRAVLQLVPLCLKVGCVRVLHTSTILCGGWEVGREGKRGLRGLGQQLRAQLCRAVLHVVPCCLKVAAVRQYVHRVGAW